MPDFHKTEIEGIVSPQKGVFLDHSIKGDYEIARKMAMIEKEKKSQLESRINIIENDISSIKDMLMLLLRK